MANKVKYGLKNVHFAKANIAADGTATYDTPKLWPGAVNLSLSPEGDISKFFADNVAYAQFAANAGYSGSFESALIPEEFKTDIMGWKKDSNGVLYEDAGAHVEHFALLFQFEGDANSVRHVIYNCVAARANVEGATTEDSIEAKTESIDLTAGSIRVSALDADISKASLENTAETKTTYDSWFTSVYQPVAD